MSAPETTSAEAFWRYAGGECLFEGRGEAWRDIKAWLTALPPAVDTLHIPSLSEPFLAWVTSGEVDFQEREGDRPWVTNRIRKGSFFLTTGGAPYDVRWKAVSPEPFETMLVFIELPVLQRALEEVFGPDAPNVRLQDASTFDDEVLNSLLGVLREELMRREASPGFVEALARAIAIHLARAYGVADEEAHGSSPSLPGHKLRQITDWMAEPVAEEFSLDRLAARAGLSKYHFQRLFKAATGVTPSHYQIDLRMNEARRLLRETKMARQLAKDSLDIETGDVFEFSPQNLTLTADGQDVARRTYITYHAAPVPRAHSTNVFRSGLGIGVS